MIRVLLDCRMQDWTGVGRYTVGLTRALARRDDVEIVQVVLGDAEPPAEGDVLRASKPVLSFAGGRELGRLARAAQPDVVHCLQYPTPRPTWHPLVVTLHDLSPIIVYGTMPSFLKRRVYRSWNRRAVSVADALIADSTHTAHDVAVHLGADRSRIDVVPLATDDFADGSVDSLPPRLAELAAQSYLLSMGNTKPHKGLDDLVRAFAGFSEEHPEYRLLLVGQEDAGWLARHVADTPFADRVFFTGRVTDGELRSLYAACTAFVFPSHYEGFGLPPLEAMHYGAPAVCSTAASLPEVVGDAALLFEAGDTAGLADQLALIVDDQDVRRRIIEAGSRRATAFSWEATATGTVAVYRAVIEDAGRES